MMHRRQILAALLLVGAVIGPGAQAHAKDKVSERINIVIDARGDPYKAAEEYHEKVSSVVRESNAKVIRINCRILVDGRKGLDMSWIRIKGWRLKRLDVRHTIIVSRGPIERVIKTSLIDLQSRSRSRHITQTTIIR